MTSYSSLSWSEIITAHLLPHHPFTLCLINDVEISRSPLCPLLLTVFYPQIRGIGLNVNRTLSLKALWQSLLSFWVSSSSSLHDNWFQPLPSTSIPFPPTPQTFSVCLVLIKNHWEPSDTKSLNFPFLHLHSSLSALEQVQFQNKMCSWLFLKWIK